MVLYKRSEVSDLVASIKKGKISPVYLIFGERYLGRDACEEVVAALLPEARDRENNLETMDGDDEDIGKIIHRLRTYSLFPGRKVLRVTNTRVFHSREVAKKLWEKASQAFGDGEPQRAVSYLRQMLRLAGISAQDFGDAGLTEIGGPKWQEMFGFPRPGEDLTWTQELLAGITEGDATSVGGGDGAERLEQTLKAGIPKSNILILTAETLDKRKRLYKYLEKEGVVLDLSVDQGSSSKARKDQDLVLRDLVTKALAEFGKQIEARAVPLLLERVGFHPVAVVREVEKLALYTGEAKNITIADLNAVVGRTREEALYEFTEAVSSRKLEEAVTILNRLGSHGTHPLAILAGLRNHMHKLLLVRGYQAVPVPLYRPRMDFADFQKNYLPALKESRTSGAEVLDGHPYAVYRLFGVAETFTIDELKKGIAALLDAEYMMKGSNLSAQTVMENLLFLVVGGYKPPEEMW